MIPRLVDWSLQFAARVFVAGMIGHALISAVWGWTGDDDAPSDFPLCWFGCSLMCGGPLMAAVIILFPGPEPRTTGGVLLQLKVSMAAFCIGCILLPVGVIVAAVRAFLP
jgi:hypothetical protein